MLQEDVILKPLLPTLIQLETNGPTPVEQARSLPLPLLSLLRFTCCDICYYVALATIIINSH